MAEQVVARASSALEPRPVEPRQRAQIATARRNRPDSMVTGPSLLVCNWNRPFIFKVEPSSTASATASATSFDTASG